MADVDDFLAATMPRLAEAETALHNGDAGPRQALWSRNDPVTPFGAAVSVRKWGEIDPAFDWLASTAAPSAGVWSQRELTRRMNRRRTRRLRDEAVSAAAAPPLPGPADDPDSGPVRGPEVRAIGYAVPSSRTWRRRRNWGR